MVCEGGSFDQGALNINLGVQTTTASGTAGFNGNLLGTLSGGQKRDDLGIMLKDEWWHRRAQSILQREGVLPESGRLESHRRAGGKAGRGKREGR